MTKPVKKNPVHACLDRLMIQENELIFAGRTMQELADLAGQTPFYAYSEKLMTERVQELRRAMPDFVHLHYAIKANPHPAVVQHFATLVDGLDVASGGELRVALASGMRPASISFAGPGKQREELHAAVEAGIVINIESHREMHLISELGTELGKRPKVAIRVNPDFELKASGMRMGGGPKQFGIDAELVPEVLRQLPELGLDFQGFHVFSGSQNLRPEAICEAQTLTIELATKLSKAAPGPIRMLNIGGGFGIPYFPGEDYLDLKPIADNLERLRPAIENAMPEAEVIIELGRYLVGEAGIYVCQIIDHKVSRGETFLIADGGLHHHLAASGNFGQVIRKNYPVVIGNRVRASGAGAGAASVVGPLCTPLDLLADKMPLAHGEVGDMVTVLQSGAYGYTASPHLFLSQPMPVEICV